MSEADDGPAGILHTVRLLAVARRPFREIMRGPVDVDRHLAVPVEEVRPGVAGFDQRLGVRGKPVVAGLQEVQPSPLQIRARQTLEPVQVRRSRCETKTTRAAVPAARRAAPLGVVPFDVPVMGIAAFGWHGRPTAGAAGSCRGRRRARLPTARPSAGGSSSGRRMVHEARRTASTCGIVLASASRSVSLMRHPCTKRKGS